MALRQIREIGDEILQKKCREVKEVTPRVKELIDDMFETLYEADGVGLAAPQIGLCRRIFIMHLEEGSFECINPEVTERKGKQRVQEGCLSCPNVWGYVKRPYSCTLRAQDRNGNYYEKRLEGIFCRCACHETDHLDGKLFIDLVDEFVEPEE